MKKILLATALAALAPAALLAGGSHPHGDDMLKRWDSNNDGTVSRDEAKAASDEHIAKMFDKLDTNKDGQVSTDELKAHHSEMRRDRNR